MELEALIRVSIFAAEELLERSPEAFAKLQAIFSKPGVTVQDLRTAREEIAASHYKDFVKDTSIPEDQQT